MKPKFTAVLSSQEEEEAEMAQTRLVQANAALCNHDRAGW